MEALPRSRGITAGFFAQVADGTVQKAVNESCDKRHPTLPVARRFSLVQTSTPISTKKLPTKSNAQRLLVMAALLRERPNALSMKRAATDFEALRLATEAAAKRPKVFMLTIGNLAMRLARPVLDQLTVVPGYEIIDNLGSSTPLSKC